jgi:magnesium chelatase subunit I
MEFVLWALAEFKQLSKKRTAAGLSFNDMYDSFLTGL